VDIAIDLYGEKPRSPSPAVVFVHGGGLILGSRKALLPVHVQAFIEAGFVFASIDYRLAPEAHLPEIVSDLDDAWTWVGSHASELGIDSRRIVLLGHSAGAFLALLGGCRLSPPPAAIISAAG
jgi:acetyl esterase/lipase